MISVKINKTVQNSKDFSFTVINYTQEQQILIFKMKLLKNKQTLKLFMIIENVLQLIVF